MRDDREGGRPSADPARKFRLPLTAREREILLATGIENLDLARRVRLPPLVDGWATIALTQDELDRLTWIACQIDDHELNRELIPLRGRMRRVLHGEPAPPDPEPVPPSPEPPGVRVVVVKAVGAGVTVQLSDRERRCLERNRELLEGLPPDVRDELTAEGPQGVELLIGEAMLLLDRLDEVSMSEETPDLVAHDMISVRLRIQEALKRAAGQPAMRLMSPAQRIPIALRRSEAELLHELAPLLPAIGEGLELDEDGQCWRVWLTLDEVEQLLGEVLVEQEEERVSRLEQRLHEVQRHFHWRPPLPRR